MSEKYIVMEWGVDKFNVDKDGFSPEFNRDILKEPFKRGWSSIIISQSDFGWY
jgi:hypothetical protein